MTTTVTPVPAMFLYTLHGQSIRVGTDYVPAFDVFCADAREAQDQFARLDVEMTTEDAFAFTYQRWYELCHRNPSHLCDADRAISWHSC